MGRAKLLLPFGAGTVVGGTVRALGEGGAREVALVVAAGDGELAAWGRERGLVVMVNPEPERGMLSSVRCGLEALGGVGELSRRGVPLLVSPADLPRLAAVTVGAVVAALCEGALLAVPVYEGKRGHPLGIAPALLPEIGGLDLAVGLHQLLERHGAAVVEVPVDDPGAVRDVDTPADYRRLAGRPLPGDDPETPSGQTR
jgi:molybdenum cofactor cytidylyltransferase